MCNDKLYLGKGAIWKPLNGKFSFGPGAQQPQRRRGKGDRRDKKLKAAANHKQGLTSHPVYGIILGDFLAL
jgi:hypothetical protein